MKRSMIGVAALVLAGCGRSSELPMSTAAFVDVMVELRRAGAEVSASGGDYVARREEILSAAGITEESLRAYVEVAARRPKELSAAFDSITARLIVVNQVQ